MRTIYPTILVVILIWRIKEVERMHGYDVPCIEVLDVAGGSEEYLEWVEKEVRN